MLVDKSHLGWGIGTCVIGAASAVPLIASACRDTAGYTAASVLGVWFGVIALGLMIYAVLLSAVRLSPARLELWPPHASPSSKLATSLAVIAFLAGAAFTAAAWGIQSGLEFSESIGIAVAAIGLLVDAGLLLMVKRRLARLDARWPWVTSSLMLAIALLAVAVLMPWIPFARSKNVVLWTQAALLLTVPILARIGARRTWLRGHIWLGLLSGWFVVLHSRLGLGGLLEQMLWVLLVLTLLTGGYGLVLQQVLPRQTTARFRLEVPVGQHDHACRLLRAAADKAVEAVCGAGAATVDATRPDDVGDASQALATRYHHEIRGFLAMPYARKSLLADPLEVEGFFAELERGFWSPEDRAQIRSIRDLCERRRLLGEQERLHGHLHRWLLWHIPLSSAMIALALLHAVVSLWY
jgi:hypothetical protein